MLNRQIKYLSAIVSTTLLFTIGAATAAQENQVGIVGLYRVANPENAIVDTDTVIKLGCKVRHSGIIEATQRKIDLAQPNQFIFLACNDTLLDKSNNQKILSSLVKGGKRLAILEGELTDFLKADISGTVTERQYILKISHYNNKDTIKRDSELAALTSEATLSPDSYQTESFIGVNHALGLPTPDEVVILFYDNPEAGNRFRNNNGNLMRRIGKFNQAHLVDAVYYVGKAVN
jgi:hypothetical protein